jgi:hypothetical protein
LIGCAGGIAIYFAAKSACHARNVGRTRRRIPEDVARTLAPHFPALDLATVRIVAGSSLPPNWLGPRVFRASAMTFGRTIFFVDAEPFRGPGAVRLLAHELVHVEQVRRLGGERAFACAYGRGYVEGGSYRANPLEVEAYEVEARVY